MRDPTHPDPYVDEVPYDPGDQVPKPEPEQGALDGPDDPLPPEEQADE